MTGAKQIMGSSFLSEKSFLIPSSKFLICNPYYQQHNKLSFSPVLLPLNNRKKLSLENAVRTPVEAICEGLVKVESDVEAICEELVKVENEVTAVVTITKKDKDDFKEAVENVVLQLISTEIDPKTEEPKKSYEVVLELSQKSGIQAESDTYTAEFTLESDFGVPGAISVTNNYEKEFLLESIVIKGLPFHQVHFTCNSWVQSKKDQPKKRVFFSNMPYLPWETPDGLKELRKKELKELRGDGTGLRKQSDRIYDYATYNDLGNPDKETDLSRPTLGGEAIPYPRRCRTGRQPTHSDIDAESPVDLPSQIYVPRDEAFEESKENSFCLSFFIKGVLHSLIPTLISKISPIDPDFKRFSDVDLLYKKGILLENFELPEELKNLPLINIISKIEEFSQALLKYETPMIISKDKFSWLRDDEFARQTIAGMNPVNIERLKEFPPVSKLDPPQQSALKDEHIIDHLNGISIQQALEENKLFILDYHDTYLPFLKRINAVEGRKAYATRTIFFLTPVGTLEPIAIELSLPQTDHLSSSKRVISPPVDATSNWQWQLAKAHARSNDCGVHQLVNHWLRTHACMEPFILAAHRQLSVMHPIFKLLDPHMRYTLEINALARQALINAGGVIESCFTPSNCCMEISAVVYKDQWRFNQEGLPADLLRRGMAIKDDKAPHGLKLLIEDYPYATDGLLIWSAIEKWVNIYVNYYYPKPDVIANDTELQAWYKECVNMGHADLCDASWWPKLETTDDLTSILTTLIWIASAQHAAVNFGQYPYGGYFPNHPPLMRKLIPDENDPEYTNFLENPEEFFLSALPNLLQAIKFMSVIDLLSTHSPDEEYLGKRDHHLNWSGDAYIVSAFSQFSEEMRQIEKEIDKRNGDASLRNRCGAGVLPYQLLAPSSKPGVTGRGVPNSISI